MNKTNHVTILLIASTLAMIGLVFFQYKWINHSRNLSEEIFNQRASMALCSTLEDYGEGTSCSEASCAVACGKEESLIPTYTDFVGRPEICLLYTSRKGVKNVRRKTDPKRL